MSMINEILLEDAYAMLEGPGMIGVIAAGAAASGVIMHNEIKTKTDPEFQKNLKILNDAKAAKKSGDSKKAIKLANQAKAGFITLRDKKFPNPSNWDKTTQPYLIITNQITASELLTRY